MGLVEIIHNNFFVIKALFIPLGIVSVADGDGDELHLTLLSYMSGQSTYWLGASSRLPRGSVFYDWLPQLLEQN